MALVVCKQYVLIDTPTENSNYNESANTEIESN